MTVNIGEFGGFTKLAFSKLFEHRLYAGSTQGDVSVIDPRNGEIIRTLKGHADPVNDFKEISLFEESMLVTAGDDNICMFFRAKE